MGQPDDLCNDPAVRRGAGCFRAHGTQRPDPLGHHPGAALPGSVARGRDQHPGHAFGMAAAGRGQRLIPRPTSIALVIRNAALDRRAAAGQAGRAGFRVRGLTTLAGVPGRFADGPWQWPRAFGAEALALEGVPGAPHLQTLVGFSAPCLPPLWRHAVCPQLRPRVRPDRPRRIRRVADHRRHSPHSDHLDCRGGLRHGHGPRVPGHEQPRERLTWHRQTTAFW